MNAQHVPPKAMVTFAESMNAFTKQQYDYVLLGAVPDGPDVAHVVFRQNVNEDEPWSGEIAELLAAKPADEQQLERESWARGLIRLARCRKQADGTWRLNAGHGFLAVDATSYGAAQSE